MAALDDSYEESFDPLPQSGPSGLVGGTLLLIKNPVGSGNVEAEVKDTLRVNVAECNVGKTHTIVEVKDSSRYSSSLLERDNNSMVKAVFSETVSITISGDKLPSIGSVIEICTEIDSHNLKCDLSNTGRDITIRGAWNHVKVARERIQRLIMDSIHHHDDDDTTNTISSTSPHHDGSTIDSTDNRISSSGSRATGTYTECISVFPHVMKMMKRKNISFGPGASHNEGTSSVLFRFQSEEELDAAIDRFQSQANIFEENFLSATIPVPQGIHKDENFVLIVSELEDKYKDTMITWVDGKIEIEVITDKQSMDLVMRDLKLLMEKAATPTGTNPVVLKRSTSKSSGNFVTRALDNLFRLPITPPPVVEYQKQVILQFPDHRSITLKHGNILDETVDAIVNPANEKLMHGGGLAKQIDKASRGAVGRQSDNLLQQMGGRVPTGMVVRTEAGNGKLLCNHVFHAVGPNAHEIRSERECQDLLCKTIRNITDEACKAYCNTIAIPAISSGVFGMEKDVVAEIIIGVLVDFQQQRPNHDYLKDIRVVIWDRETYDPFLTIVLGVKNSLKFH